METVCLGVWMCFTVCLCVCLCVWVFGCVLLCVCLCVCVCLLSWNCSSNEGLNVSKTHRRKFYENFIRTVSENVSETHTCFCVYVCVFCAEEMLEVFLRMKGIELVSLNSTECSLEQQSFCVHLSTLTEFEPKNYK